MTTLINVSEAGNLSDDLYSEYLKRIQARFTSNTAGQTLFTTDASGLYTAYLDALSADEQLDHDCHACRWFVDRFGGLVTIGKDGRTKSAIWNIDDATDLYKASTKAVLEVIQSANVTGVFLSSDTMWGKPVTGMWTHMAVLPATDAIYKRSVLTPGQAMAEKREDLKNVTTALDDFDLATLEQAIRLAPPIIQWDRLEECNPASAYLWHDGSLATQYGLPHGVYVDVAAVTLQPSQWGSKPFAHQGQSVTFLIQGARETRNPGMALFPEILKSELHGVRSVIEAYSKTA